MHPLHSIAPFLFCADVCTSTPALHNSFGPPCLSKSSPVPPQHHRQPTAAVGNASGGRNGHGTRCSCWCCRSYITLHDMLQSTTRYSYIPSPPCSRHVANQPLKQTCIMDLLSGCNNPSSKHLYVHPSFVMPCLVASFGRKKLGRGGDVQLTAIDHVAPWAIRRVSDHWDAAVPAYFQLPAASSQQLLAAIPPLASWLTFLPEPGTPTCRAVRVAMG